MNLRTLLLAFVTMSTVAAGTDYGKLPLHFEPNLGQAYASVRYLARGSGLTAYLAPREAVLAFGTGRRTAVHMRFSGARDPRLIEGIEHLPGKINYLVGGDRARWRTNIPTYGKVRYSGIYDGVDLVFYGNQRRLEYDFIVAPGADPAQIRIEYQGAEGVRLTAQGDLEISTSAGILRQLKPVAYQMVEGRRQSVAANYRATGQGFSFALGAYDDGLPLIIDPVVLVYSTYLGGSGEDYGHAIAVDSTGAAYIAGWTGSLDFPLQNPRQMTFGGFQDAFIAKLNPAGNALVYATYFGGAATDMANGIAVDANGSVYVTGTTFSDDFPTQVAFDASFSGGSDVFVVKFNPGGDTLGYSTFLGGGSFDEGNAIAIDSTGAAYVTGSTISSDFPTPTAYDPSQNGGLDAFAFKISPQGTALVYSTFLGGSSGDVGNGIAIDAGGQAYVVGTTQSANFPAPGGFDSSHNGGGDAFVARLSASGSALGSSTFLGGSFDDLGNSIAVDTSGVYVAGGTLSQDFPIQNAFDSTPGGNQDAFVAKLNTGLSTLAYSTYLGGSDADSAGAIAVDSAGRLTVAGDTLSRDLVTVQEFDPSFNGIQDIFIARFNPSGSGLSFFTYYGGEGRDTAKGIALDSQGAAYIAGITFSNSLPVVAALDGSFSGGSDAFVAKLEEQGPPPGPTTIQTNPPGLNVIVDGVTAPAPLVFDWIPGTVHSIQALSPQGSESSRRVFTSWSDGGAQTHNVTATATTTTYTANFSTQHRLTISASPAGGGSISASPASADGFYNAGAVVQITATPAGGAAFSGFSGDLSGTANPQNVVMNAPRAITANFSCGFSLSPPTSSFASGGGTATVTVTTTGGCSWSATSNVSWIVITGGSSGIGNGTVSYSVAANPTGVSRSGSLTIAGQTFTVVQSGGGACPVIELSLGQGLGGMLSTTDCASPVRGASHFADRYIFRGFAGQQIAVGAGSSAFDIYLYLFDPTGAVLRQDDNSGGGTNARIPAGSARITLGVSGIYTIEVTSAQPQATGIYDIRLEGSAPPGAPSIGIFRDGVWQLGLRAEDPAAGLDRIQFGMAGDLPVTGDWNGSGTTKIGIFRNGQWILDQNGNRVFDNADRVIANFGGGGDLPVAGDWSGSGSVRVGVFRGNGQWFLDFNGNGTYDGADKAYSFGGGGDRPVVGDWTGSGTAKIGVFRPGDSTFYLDLNGNGQWDGTSIDGVISTFGAPADIPVAGDWSGTGRAQLGVYREGIWYLDTNGNGILEASDRAIISFGGPGDLPVIGGWVIGAENRASKISVFRAGQWFLDTNNNGLYDGSAVDRFLVNFGGGEDIPVTGDWTGSGTIKVGVFRRGAWFLDLNGNGQWDGAPIDGVVPNFGADGDQPVTGDWNGTGVTQIGVFRRGEWFLDINGNRAWDGPAVDRAVASFGAAGDQAVAGDWNGTGVTKIGVFRNGNWFLDINNDGMFAAADYTTLFGRAGDIAIPGDWGGSGKTKLGVFRNGGWILDTNDSGSVDEIDRIASFGAVGDRPTVGNWSGSGVQDSPRFPRGRVE